MKTFKHIFLITSLLLFGGFLLAQDTGTGTATDEVTKDPKSNPPECVFICDLEPHAEGGGMNDRVLECGKPLPNITAPDTAPDISDGQLICQEGTGNGETKAVKLTYEWTLDASNVDYNTAGTYTAYLNGKAELSSDKCEKKPEEFDLTLSFSVTVQTLVYVSPGEITLCETLPVKVSCGKKIKSVVASPAGIVEVVDGNKIKGIAPGTATLTVTTYDNETVEGYVEVKNCRVIEEPEALDNFMHYFGTYCEPIQVNGEVKHVYISYYTNEFIYEKGKYIKCPEDGSASEEENGIDFGIEEGRTWFVSDNIKLYGNPTDELIGIYTEDNSPLDGSLSVLGGGPWEKCEKEGSIFKTAIEFFSPPENDGGGLTEPCEPTAFAPQNKYTGLDIHGQPKTVAKPQQEQESDSYKSDFNLDAYHMSPSFSVADISIPLQGSDLKLELRRRNSTDVTTTSSTNVDNMPHRIIMGRTWRTNIAPIVYLFTSSSSSLAGVPVGDECNPNVTELSGNRDQYWVAVDDGGGEFKYANNMSDDVSKNFLPIKKYFSDFESGLHKLSGTPGETMYFRKQNGLVFEYESIDYSVADSEITGNFSSTTTSLAQFHRAKSVTDRTGNKLNYIYNTDTDLFPERIEYDQNPQLYIDLFYNLDQSRLLKAIDSLGREIIYEYEDGLHLTKVIKPSAPVANANDRKTTQDQTQEFVFEYGSITIPLMRKSSFLAERPAKTTHFMKKMTDPELNDVSMTYTVVTESKKGKFGPNEDPEKFVVLKTLKTPDGTISATVRPITSTFRIVDITDSGNKTWQYKFSGTTQRAVYSAGASLSNPFVAGQCELLLDTFYRTQVSASESSRMMYAHFITDGNSSINMDKVTDYHGISTQYIYGTQPVTYFRNGVEVTETYNFGAHNQPYQEILDPGGLNIVKEFGYEENTNQMVRIVDGNGNVTTYDLDDQGNRLREIAPVSKETRFSYDLGFQTSATDADGRRSVSKRIYSVDGWIDVNVVLLTYGDTRSYDDLGLNLDTYVHSNTDDMIVTVRKFDLVGNMIESIDGNGNVTINKFDATNSLEYTELPPVEDFDAENNTPVRPKISFTRNKNRQVVGKQDARGNWTFTEYDGMLRPKKTSVEFISDPTKNIVTTTEYDATGNKSVVIDPRGIRYEFKYDAFNNLIEEKKDVGGLNLTSTYEYGEGSGNDVFGDTGFVPTKKVDPRGISTLLEYDNAYRLIRTYRGFEDRESLLSEITYDNAGNVVKTLTFNNQISNLEGEYISASSGLTSGNQETVTEYDGLNRPIATAVDLDGDGASIDDADDMVTNTFYDLTGNVVITIDAEGHSSQTEYDAAGRVVKQVVNLDDEPNFTEVEGNFYSIVTHADDIVTSKTYDENSNVLTETIINDTPGAVGNQVVTKTYDALNRVVTVVDPMGYASDEEGASFPLGYFTETKYDLNNNVRSVKNNRGNVTITEYDEANRAIRQILPQVFDAEANSGIGVNVAPQVLTFYDKNSNVVKTVDARGLTTLNVYDKLNRLEETRQVIGADDRTSGETDDIVSENGYDDNNNLVETTFFRDDTQLATSTVYDALDRPLVTIDPEGFQSVVFCDLVGNKVKLFDKRANTKIIDDVETKDEVPQLRYYTQVTFDLANRMIKNTLPIIPIASRDEFGVVSEENIQPFSEVFYQKNNWVDSTIDLNGNETSTIYDNAGRKLTVTNAIGQNISYTYDKSSNVLVQTVENHDSSGGNQLTTYTYDKRNLLLTETLNLGHATLERTYTYTYDENGNKKTRLFPNGDTSTYNYDALDRLNSEVYANAVGENRTYSYNNNGAVVTCTDNTGTVKYKYDILGRQITETKLNTDDVAVSTVESIYDKANNRIRCFFPDQKKTLVSLYDKRNLLTKMNAYHGKVLLDDEAAYPGQAEITTYAYNANGSQVSCTLPNGQTTAKEFDSADRIINTTTSSQVLAETVNSYSAEYKRDAVGNQLQTIETRSIANGPGTRSRILNFIYDATYRLTIESDNLSGQTVVNTYIYDLQGNRLSRIQKNQDENDQDSWIYTNDLLNRTTAVQIDLKGIDRTSAYTYQYDDNGNREVRTHINEDNETSTHTYSYDQENRLINVNDGSDNIFKASYDYRTRRTAKTEVNAQDEFETVSYIYDGGVSCQEVKVTTPGDEYDGTNGSLDKQYIRGNGMGGGIGSVCYMERPADFGSVSSNVQNFYDTAGYGPTDLNGSSNMLAEYYTYNAVGSVVANTDQQGFVIRENDFDAYGNQVREQDWTSNNFPIEFGGSQNDLLFSTKERDFSTGLDYFGFRYYDAVLGKFTTRDPSGYPDGPNNYLYCNNNPINCIDPLGLAEQMAAFDRESGVGGAGTAEIRNNMSKPTVDPNTSNSYKGADTTKAMKALGMGTASTIPFVGEGMDVDVLIDSKSSGWERLGAGSSLLLSVLTGGFSPNFGAFSKMEKVLDSATDAERIRDAQNVTDAINDTQKVDKVADSTTATKVDTEVKINNANDETVTLFKAPQKGRDGAKEVVEGYDPKTYPGEGPFFSTEKGVSEKYQYHYQNGLQEINIPKKEYDNLVEKKVIQKDTLEKNSVNVPEKDLEKFNEAIKKGPENKYIKEGDQYESK